MLTPEVEAIREEARAFLPGRAQALAGDNDDGCGVS